MAVGIASTSNKLQMDLKGFVNGTGVKDVVTGKAQEMVSRLKEEVQVLQEEILRTRVALDQRNSLLSNSATQEIELRNHFDS